VRPVLVGMGSADFGDKRRAIAAGRRAMQRVLPQLQAAMAAKQQ
jgi:NTE family protein